MSITSAECRPTIGQILLTLAERTTRRIIGKKRLRLTPDADIGIVLLDPLNEIVVVIVLILPHSAEHIPQQHTNRTLLLGPRIHQATLD